MNFVLINRSRSVSAAQAAAMALAIQTQMNRDVLPAWRRTSCSVVAGELRDAGDLGIVLADTVDEAGALGYHVEDSSGAIRGIIGVQTIVEAGGGIMLAGANGDSVCSVTSHEVIEAKFDPNCNLYADTLGLTAGYSSMAFELCDPVQGSGYQIGPAQVSNFVLPSYFDPHGPGPWDFLKRLRGPFSLEDGGYAILRNSPSDEKAVFGAGGDCRPWRAHRRASARTSR